MRRLPYLSALALTAATACAFVADRAIMTGYHYGVPGAGRIEKDGDGYAFVPIA